MHPLLNKHDLFAWMLACFVLGAGVARAHEGHVHRVMGTITSVHDNSVEVKTTAGKASVITVTDKTKVIQGKTSVKRSVIKPGHRVVVTAVESKDRKGKVVLLARQITLGALVVPKK